MVLLYLYVTSSNNYTNIYMVNNVIVKLKKICYKL